MIITGTVFLVGGLLLVPALLEQETRTAILEMVKPYTISALCASVFAAAGALFLFAGGLLWNREPDNELPLVCPECGADLKGKVICPECETNAMPPLPALDTASLAGAVLSLLCAGAVAAAPFIGFASAVIGIMTAAALIVSGISFIMAFGSLTGERRKTGAAAAALVLSAAVFGILIYILL